MTDTGTAPLRVCHLISSLDVGGAEVSLLRLLSRMNGRRFENRVVSLIPAGSVGERIRDLGVTVDSLEMRRGRPSAGVLLRLVRMLRHERPDVLQTWLYHADLLGLLAASLAARPPVVWNIRSWKRTSSRHRRLSRLVIRMCARLSAWPRAVVVNSEAGRSFHAAIGYHPRQWVVIPNGVDVEEFRPDPASRAGVRRELGLPSDALLVTMVARFHPVKDHRTFLQAAGILSRENAEARFLLAGEEITEGNEVLARLVQQEGLAGRVQLLGRRDDVPRLWAASDFAVLSSVSEGFPNVVAEAMACAVPCVVTDVGDARRIVGETGLVVPPGSPEALAAAMREMSARGATRLRELGGLARERISREYGLSRMVGAYEELYEQLAGPSSRAAERLRVSG